MSTSNRAFAFHLTPVSHSPPESLLSKNTVYLIKALFSTLENESKYWELLTNKKYLTKLSYYSDIYIFTLKLRKLKYVRTKLKYINVM